ncbi:hypothetical protein V7S43_015721 [Phytophthora oleae]|uniref:RxLR effector protein n=1 Tax=Phytophthora oleae TaxID=2107226 RepID=A0ABD3F0K9_9STRA
MRFVTFLLLQAVAFTLCFSDSNAQTKNATPEYRDNPVRYLKGAVEQSGVLNAADEERGWQDIADKLENTNILKNKEEFKDANAAKLESVAEKVEAGGKLKAGNSAKIKWQNALAKLKEEGKLTEKK